MVLIAKMSWTGYEVDQNKALHIIIDGMKYDLTKWKNVHPGGHFILHQYSSFYLVIVMILSNYKWRYDQKDATDVFTAFHGPEAYARLKNMKGVPVESPVDAKTAAFR